MKGTYYAGEFETMDGERIVVMSPSFTRGWIWMTTTETRMTMGPLSEAIWRGLNPEGTTRDLETTGVRPGTQSASAYPATSDLAATV